jgi:hypothetical protein
LSKKKRKLRGSRKVELSPPCNIGFRKVRLFPITVYCLNPKQDSFQTEPPDKKDGSTVNATLKPFSDETCTTGYARKYPKAAVSLQNL